MDSVDDLSGNETYIFQPYGTLLSPQVDPFEFTEDITGNTLSISKSFETGEPSLNDPCPPWNVSCRQIPQPFSERHTFNWGMGFHSLEVDFDVEVDAGSAKLTIVNADGDEVLQESFSESGSIDDLLRPVQPGAWKFIVELDRFEGSFDLTGAEGPALEGGGNGGGGSGNGNGGGDGSGGGEGNATNGDVDTGETPAPGIVVLLAILAGLVALRRRQ